MIKRLNAGILNFIKRIKFRSVGATILGGFAGLSLSSNILPSVMSYGGITDSFSARWALGGYAVYSMMLWAVGGWAVQKTGSKSLGAVTLGSVGMVSGLLMTASGISTSVTALLYGGCAAMLYGAVGGMIIGDALREPVQSEQSPSVPNATEQRGVRLFRFFK